MSREQPDFCLRSLRYNLIVGFDTRFGISLGDAVGAQLRRSLRRRRGWWVPDDKTRLRTERERAGDKKTAWVSQMNAQLL